MVVYPPPDVLAVWFVKYLYLVDALFINDAPTNTPNANDLGKFRQKRAPRRAVYFVSRIVSSSLLCAGWGYSNIRDTRKISTPQSKIARKFAMTLAAADAI